MGASGTYPNFILFAKTTHVFSDGYLQRSLVYVCMCVCMCMCVGTYVNDFLYSSYSPPWPNRPHDMKVKDTSDSSGTTTKKDNENVGWSSSNRRVNHLPMPRNSRYARKEPCTIPTYRNALEDARWCSAGRPTKFWWWNASLWILRSAWHGAYSTAWANLCMYVFRNLKKIRFRRVMYVCMYVCMYVIDSVFFLTNTPWVTPRHVTRSNMYQTNSKVYVFSITLCNRKYVCIYSWSIIVDSGWKNRLWRQPPLVLQFPITNHTT